MHLLISGSNAYMGTQDMFMNMDQSQLKRVSRNSPILEQCCLASIEIM